MAVAFYYTCKNPLCKRKGPETVTGPCVNTPICSKCNKPMKTTVDI